MKSTTHTPLSSGIQFGFNSMYPAPGIVERIGPDWDWIWIDGQHGQLGGYTELLSMVRACNLIHRPAFVRVPSHENGWISLALDMNPAGIIIPQVDSTEQAEAVVRAAKFPPLGNRSYGGRRPIDFLGRTYSNAANENTKLICQIESDEALANVESIAALPGVDGLFLGPDDLMLRRGEAMDRPRNFETMAECLKTMVEATQTHGKLSITVAQTEEMITFCTQLGMTHLVCGGDVAFLANASKTASAQARETAAKALANNGIAVQNDAPVPSIY